MTTKFWNLYRVSRVLRPVVVAFDASSINITGCSSSDQKLKTISADDPTMPTVCTSLL